VVEVVEVGTAEPGCFDRDEDVIGIEDGKNSFFLHGMRGGGKQG